MAKGTLEFNLDDFDDIRAFNRAASSLDVCVALWEMMHNTKKGFQYDVEAFPDSVSIGKDDMYDLIDKIYGKFWEILNEHNVNLDKLVN